MQTKDIKKINKENRGYRSRIKKTSQQKLNV